MIVGRVTSFHRPGPATRRTFLSRALGALGAAAGVALTGGWSRAAKAATLALGARRLDRIGIQLYTVRHLMERDADATLASLSAIGYREVELAGLYGHSAREMRQMLDRHGLRGVSGHTDLRGMRRAWAQLLDDAATLGQRYVVCAWIPESERRGDDFRRIAGELNRLGESARSRGLQLAYHNHTYEFTPVDGIVPYDLLLARCDPHLVQMEADLMWMTRAGGDPLAYFASYPGRFPMVHVKDMTRDGTMVDVGRGVIDFRAIFARSEQAGIAHYFVEHDEPPDPLADARVCYDYLRQLTF